MRDEPAFTEIFRFLNMRYVRDTGDRLSKRRPHGRWQTRQTCIRPGAKESVGQSSGRHKKGRSTDQVAGHSSSSIFLNS